MREKGELFPLGPIIINIFAIGVLVGIYYTVVSGGLLPDYQVYVYWTVNVLISYNIIAASARSFLMPIATLLAGIAALIALYRFDINFLTVAQAWQVLALGLVGLFITCSLKL